MRATVCPAGLTGDLTTTLLVNGLIALTRDATPDWRRQVQFSLCVVDQRESLCSVTKSTRGELSNQVLDWGFTELAPLSTLHSSNHGYIVDDTLQFTIQFERISEAAAGSSPQGTASPRAQPGASPSSLSL